MDKHKNKTSKIVKNNKAKTPVEVKYQNVVIGHSFDGGKTINYISDDMRKMMEKIMFNMQRFSVSHRYDVLEYVEDVEDVEDVEG